MTSFGATTPVSSRALNTAFLQLENQIAGASGSPIGSIVMWAGTTANIPTGYALCNGASLATTGTYASLFDVLQYRYGGSGANFSLPDFTSRVPEGITGVPTVPTTDTTSASSAVDVHTHGVNSSFTAGNAASHTHSGGVFTQGNANTHTHSGGTVSGANSTIANAATHSHPVIGNTGNASDSHQHTYYKPNSGANSSTGFSGSVHTHGMLFNSGNANATGINGANSNIGVNAQGAPNAGLGMSVSAPGAPNATIGVNSSFTAGDASTINSSTPAHTHTVNITQVIFIIKVV